MNPVLDGGCQCGRVRYRIEGEPLGLAVCHCRGCQRQSGSAFGMSLAVPSAAFHLVSGTLKAFSVPCDSGRTKTCSFCPDCGTRIHHRVFDAALSVKAGTLDDPSTLAPGAHYWTQHKLPWVLIPEGTRGFPDDG